MTQTIVPFGLTRQAPLPPFTMPDLVYDPVAQINRIGSLDGPALADSVELMPKTTETYKTGTNRNDTFSDDVES